MNMTTSHRLILENYSFWQRPFVAFKSLPPILLSIKNRQIGTPFSIHIKSCNGALLSVSANEISYPVIASEQLAELKDLICRTEDIRFFKHKGIDWKGVLRAAFVNLSQTKIKQGGSTITQQLARNIFLSPHKSITRKLCEAVIALWIERILSKDEILTAYCNSVYLGCGLRGFEAASRFIFRRSLNQLQSHQLAGLTGLLCAPNRYHPLKNKESFFHRKAQLTARLSIIDRPIQINPISNKIFNAPRIEKQIVSVLNSMKFSDVDVQAIETTINKKLQHEIDLQLKAVSMGDNIKNVAVVVICNHTGDILTESSWSGGKTTEFSPTFNGKIQPGSTYKPFAIISALEQGISLDTQFESAPFSRILNSQHPNKAKWSVRNYRDHYYGFSSIADALVNSDNSVFARLALGLDQSLLAETYKRFGLICDEKFTPAAVLGGIREGKSLLDIAAAYSAIARNGVYLSPRLLKFIQFRDSTFHYIQRPAGRILITPAVCEQINRILRQSGIVLSNGIIAGKSGTTKTGSLFAGYDRNVSLALWVNFKKSPSEYDNKAVTARNAIVKLADAILGYKHPRLLEII